jgi:hypothetical protein
MRIVTVHGELVQETKKKTAGRFGAKWWQFDGEEMKTRQHSE